MTLSTRFSNYCIGQVLNSTQTFSPEDKYPLAKDVGFPLLIAHKSMMIKGGKVTVSATVAGGAIELYLASSLNPNVPIFATAFANVDISAAATEKALVFGTWTKSPRHFVLSDAIPATKADWLEENWNYLVLCFKVTGATVPAGLNITFDLDFVGMEGSGRK